VAPRPIVGSDSRRIKRRRRLSSPSIKRILIVSHYAQAVLDVSFISTSSLQGPVVSVTLVYSALRRLVESVSFLSYKRLIIVRPLTWSNAALSLVMSTRLGVSRRIDCMLSSSSKSASSGSEPALIHPYLGGTKRVANISASRPRQR
jgi:hypothetical protein